MVVASLTLAFLVPGSQSLKEKRHVVKSVKDRIRSRFNVSVAEVDFQDLWQRGTLGVAVAATDGYSARRALEEVVRFVRQDARLLLLDEIIEFR
jgi:hypothetical protein